MKRPIFPWMLSALLLFSCGNDKSHYELIHEGSGGASVENPEDSEACRMVTNLLDGADQQRTLFVVDSLEKARALSAVAANYYRGMAYSKDKQLRTTEYYKVVYLNEQPDHVIVVSENRNREHELKDRLMLEIQSYMKEHGIDSGNA